MKILWVTNTIFPDLSKIMKSPPQVVGGWMVSLANDLLLKGVDLTIVTARQNIKKEQTKINGISYYLLETKKPITTLDNSLAEKWKKVISEVQPDVVHIHGTEYAHGLSLMKVCPNLNYVISIQGLISVYARYYRGNVSRKEIKKFRTFRDFIKRDSILQAQTKLELRGEEIEKKYFQLGKHFIGRTQWDYDHTKTLAKYAKYHFCNESLRSSFYASKKWNLNQKQNHSIFLSQAIFPLKGLHQVIKALSLLIHDFPNIKLRVAGSNILKSDTFRDTIAFSGYSNYIRHLIHKFSFQDKVKFMGVLSEKEMIEEYLNCHLFICPSSIENSPNSLGEAQLLGVPCIASYVGGIPDMIEHNETGLLYRFEEVEMLSQSIRQIFTNSSLAEKLSKNGIQVAEERHNKEENAERTKEIYQNILKKN